MGVFGFFITGKDIERMEAKRNIKGLVRAARKRDAYVSCWAACALGRLCRKEAIEPLIRALKHDNEYSRADAIEQLENVGDQRAIKPLLDVWINDPDDGHIQLIAAEALGKIGGSKVTEILASGISDSRDFIRKSAVSGLGNTKDKNAVEPLIQALESEKDSTIRYFIVVALETLGDAVAVNPLTALLKNEDEDTDNIKGVIHALGELGDSGVVEPMAKACLGPIDAEDEFVAACKRMRRRGVEGLDEALATALNKVPSGYAQRVLGELGIQSGIDQLIEALKDEDYRYGAAEALGKLGDKRAVQPLINCLKDEDYTVRAEVANALEQIGDRRAVKPLLKSGELHENMTNLFGDYADLIHKALVHYGKEDIYHTLSGGKYEYNLDESDEALEKLCSIDTPISNNLLHFVKKRKDIDVTLSWSDGSGELVSEEGKLSTLHQRKYATSELERRGNPKCDPSIFLDDNAWMLR